MRVARFENRLFAVQRGLGLVFGDARRDDAERVFRGMHLAHSPARIFFSRTHAIRPGRLRAALPDAVR
ncbi:hypothetical protein F2P45_06945 [Massilia sp. CCM 8733]|uniref:Uncharacterized protein n=1 Tax=Massilia mucilaginosa TaxID=2609282 RepID=A0ABX0NPL1_9BURK|nr:hypothetical protein [Massilia mucilaginosa]NHZ88762.1 hypothetical protein [Massilia mucilaginosa]